MGWWGNHKPKNMSFKEWANKNYSFENVDIKHVVLDAALVNFTQGYLACSRTEKSTGKTYVYAMVLFIKWINNPMGNIMVKEIDETTVPRYYKCPERILNLLSPADEISEYPDIQKNINKWRADAKKYIANCKRWKKVQVGNVVTFEHGFSFGVENLATFRLSNKKRLHFEPLENSIYDIVHIRKDSIINSNFSVQ
jgi:hypothetical protein